MGSVGGGGGSSHFAIQPVRIHRPLGYLAISFKDSHDVKLASCRVSGDNLKDCSNHFCLLFERDFVVGASIHDDIVQLRHDARECFFCDFLEWNREGGFAVEGDDIYPCVDGLVFDGFSVAFAY